MKYVIKYTMILVNLFMIGGLSIGIYFFLESYGMKKSFGDLGKLNDLQNSFYTSSTVICIVSGLFIFFQITSVITINILWVLWRKATMRKASSIAHTEKYQGVEPVYPYNPPVQ